MRASQRKRLVIVLSHTRWSVSRSGRRALDDRIHFGADEDGDARQALLTPFTTASIPWVADHQVKSSAVES